MGLITDNFQVWYYSKDENDCGSCKDYEHVAEHREGLSGRVSREAEREDVSERNYAEREGYKDPLGCWIVLIEHMEQDDRGYDSDVQLGSVEDEICDPIGT